MLHTHEATGSSPVVSTKNHRNLLIPVILFYNPQLFKALNFCRFSKTHNLTHTGKGPESTGQGQTGFFLSGPVFFVLTKATPGYAGGEKELIERGGVDKKKSPS